MGEFDHSRRDDPGRIREAAGIGQPSGFKDGGWMVEDGSCALRQNTQSRLEPGSTEIGVANGIEDQIVRRKWDAGVIELRHAHRGEEDSIIPKRSGRNVTAAGRYKKQ